MSVPVRALASAVAFAVGLLACQGKRVATPLDRLGLDSIVGRQWRGDSVPVAGLVAEAGWLVLRSDGSPTHFGLHLFAAGDRRLVTLSREAARAEVHAVWTTTDAAWLPPLSASLQLATSCWRDDVFDPRLFAVVHAADAQWLTDVRQAWVADTVSGHIVPADAAGVRCENEGWGA